MESLRADILDGQYPSSNLILRHFEIEACTQRTMGNDGSLNIPLRDLQSLEQRPRRENVECCGGGDFGGKVQFQNGRQSNSCKSEDGNKLIDLQKLYDGQIKFSG